MVLQKQEKDLFDEFLDKLEKHLDPKNQGTSISASTNSSGSTSRS